MIGNITLGADPEIFFVQRGTNAPQSVEGLIGGTKYKPLPMKDLPPGFMIQEDNVAAEFNIPPASNAEEFAKNIFLGLKYVGNIAKQNKLKLHFAPDLDFPDEQLATKHCQTLGCEPDFNSWTESENPQPKAPKNMRTAAGHVHIGWNKPTWDDVMNMARAFDLYVTVPSILVTEPNRRRQLYGRAGACRPKPYGVECRSLDNFWLRKKGWVNTVYYNTMMASTMVNTGDSFTNLLIDYSDMIIDCINNHDREYAEILCNKFQIDKFPE